MGNNANYKNGLNKDDIHAVQRNNIENGVQSGNQNKGMGIKNKIIFIVSIAVITVTQFYHLMKLIRLIVK